MTKQVKKFNENLEKIIKVLTVTKSHYDVSWYRNDVPHLKHYNNLVIKRKYVYISVEHYTGSKYQSFNNLSIENCRSYESYTLKIDKTLL